MKFTKMIQKTLFQKYVFLVHVKEETYNDQQRINSIVIRTEEFDYSSESKALLALISKV